MVTVSLIRLGWSVSSAPLYRSLAEKGSAPTVPATRGWHIPATMTNTKQHQIFYFSKKQFKLLLWLTLFMKDTKCSKLTNGLNSPSSVLMDTMGLVSSRPSSPLEFTALAAHWTLEPAWKYTESRVIILDEVKKVSKSTSLIGLVTPSGPVGALTSQRYRVRVLLMFSLTQMEPVLS